MSASADPNSTSSDQPIRSNSADPEPPTSRNPRLAALEYKRANLTAKLAHLQTQRDQVVTENKHLVTDLQSQSPSSGTPDTRLVVEAANGVVKDHIKLLQRYNEIKDIGQGLMGLVAEKRGVRVTTIMDEYGMEAKD